MFCLSHSEELMWSSPWYYLNARDSRQIRLPIGQNVFWVFLFEYKLSSSTIWKCARCIKNDNNFATDKQAKRRRNRISVLNFHIRSQSHHIPYIHQITYKKNYIKPTYVISNPISNDFRCNFTTTLQKTYGESNNTLFKFQKSNLLHNVNYNAL